MKRFITTVFLAVLVAISVSPIRTEADKAPVKPLRDLSTVELILHFATQYGVSHETMYRIQNCESGFNDLANNYRPHAKNPENSWGRSQINLIAHPDVTKAQATDKVFATEYLAKHLALKDVNWTCK